MKNFLFIIFTLSLINICALADSSLQYPYFTSKSEMVSEKNETNNTRIMWWNIEGSAGVGEARNIDIHIKQVRFLNQNLSQLIQDTKRSPDILSFGEFREGIFFDKVSIELEKMYPHSHFFPDNDKSRKDVGIKVYSKLPFEIIKNKNLDWTGGRSGEEKKEYIKKYKKLNKKAVPRYSKRYIHLKFKAHDSDDYFYYLPTHLAQPWKALGAISSMQQILYGGDNPNENQLKDLLSKINNFNYDHTVILAGDFNFPQSIGSIESHGHNMILRSFRNELINNANSFPSVTAQERFTSPSMRLDNVFSKSIRSEVLGSIVKLLGSDHYPVMIDYIPRD